MRTTDLLTRMYAAMLDRLGPCGWWPADTPFEVAVGAILTQNTSWKNVAKAIANLKERGLLDPESLDGLAVEELAELIRPAGYYRLKAGRLRNFLDFLKTFYNLNLNSLKKLELHEAREQLLQVKGIGPETADSILLYALDFPVFVSDAYTARILNRHGLIHDEAGYHEIQALFMDRLEPDSKLFNEYHALLVRVGNGFCAKSKPRCAECPLGPFLEQIP